MRTTNTSYSDALRQALIDEMDQDPDVFLLGEDIGVYGGAFGITRDLVGQFGPERVVNTPISEGSFVGLAIGAALCGARPVVEIMFMDFVTLAMDQLINQAAKLRYVYGKQARCPLVVRTVGGAGRNYGPTHSQNLEACFMHIPGLKIFAPATVEDAYGMMRLAIRDNGPVVFLEHKLLYPIKASCNLTKIETNPKGSQLLAQGEDLTIIAYSYMTAEAQAAVGALEQEGYSIDLIDLRFLNPLDDQAIIDSVIKTGRVIIATEDNRTGSVAAEIACRICESAYEYLDAPITRLTVPDVPISASPSLEKAALPDRGDIYNAALELLTE